MPRPREFEPEQVLDSAMRQFWERGYRATSVDDLVRATGVKPGSLYAAFPGGKHALLMGSLDRYSKLVVPQKLGELEQPGASVDPVSRAKGLVATSQGLMVVGKANPDEEVLRAIVDNAFAGLS